MSESVCMLAGARSYGVRKLLRSLRVREFANKRKYWQSRCLDQVSGTFWSITKIRPCMAATSPRKACCPIKCNDTVQQHAYFLLKRMPLTLSAFGT